ncbi:MAG: hypothetical protein RLZZ436_817, partial [Planctomycetota bacterium]
MGHSHERFFVGVAGKNDFGGEEM